MVDDKPDDIGPRIWQAQARSPDARPRRHRNFRRDPADRRGQCRGQAWPRTVMAVGGGHVFGDRLGNFRRRRGSPRGLVGWVAGRNSTTPRADQQRRRDRCAHRARRQRGVEGSTPPPAPQVSNAALEALAARLTSVELRQPSLRWPLPWLPPLPIRRLPRRSICWKNP